MCTWGLRRTGAGNALRAGNEHGPRQARWMHGRRRLWRGCVAEAQPRSRRRSPTDGQTGRGPERSRRGRRLPANLLGDTCLERGHLVREPLVFELELLELVLPTARTVEVHLVKDAPLQRMDDGVCWRMHRAFTSLDLTNNGRPGS